MPKVADLVFISGPYANYLTLSFFPFYSQDEIISKHINKIQYLNFGQGEEAAQGSPKVQHDFEAGWSFQCREFGDIQILEEVIILRTIYQFFKRE